MTLFAVALWNGIFDLLVVRGQIFYFWQQELAASGQVPAPLLDTIMRETVRDAARTASGWAAAALVLGGWLIVAMRGVGHPGDA